MQTLSDGPAICKFAKAEIPMKNALFLAALTALPACQKALPPAPQPNDTCGAARYTHLQGAPESQILATSSIQPLRITAPRDNVTLDYLPQRLNFLLDDNGTVTAITCG